jgi:hypothetical protein
MQYQQFLTEKFSAHTARGFDPGEHLAPTWQLFDFQAAVVRWAARKGRAVIAAGTGLGKTRMQCAWSRLVADHTGGDVLIVAPLAIAEQTKAEAESIGIAITHAREPQDIAPGINITNYERLHLFNADQFTAVVLDESSRIKHHDAKTLQQLMESFGATEYKLCATATPAPNDFTELLTHAEFLGICTRAEALAEYFTHDGGKTQDWRLKGHAKEPFWAWVASWMAMFRSPEDLGFDGDRYILPPLHVHQITVESHADPLPGQLFAAHASTLTDRRTARRNSLPARVAACAERIAAEPAEPWIVWCELNAEADALCAAIPGLVEIRGTDTADEKEQRLLGFARGQFTRLATKPKIAGFGLNWQHCARVAFVGVSDSWEAYYQSIKRCHRFGQQREVHCYLFVSEEEGAVAANLARKERDADEMYKALSAETAAAVRNELLGQARISNDYSPAKPLALPSFMAAPTEPAPDNKPSPRKRRRAKAKAAAILPHYPMLPRETSPLHALWLHESCRQPGLFMGHLPTDSDENPRAVAARAPSKPKSPPLPQYQRAPYPIYSLYEIWRRESFGGNAPISGMNEYQQ